MTHFIKFPALVFHIVQAGVENLKLIHLMSLKMGEKGMNTPKRMNKLNFQHTKT